MAFNVVLFCACACACVCSCIFFYSLSSDLNEMLWKMVEMHRQKKLKNNKIDEKLVVRASYLKHFSIGILHPCHRFYDCLCFAQNIAILITTIFSRSNAPPYIKYGPFICVDIRGSCCEWTCVRMCVRAQPHKPHYNWIMNHQRALFTLHQFDICASVYVFFPLILCFSFDCSNRIDWLAFLWQFIADGQSP